MDNSISIKSVPAAETDIDSVHISADGKEIRFVMGDGTERIIEQPRSIPGFSHPDPNVHIVLALSAALLAQQERIEALERKVFPRMPPTQYF